MDKIKQFTQVKFSIIFGNQECKGAAPNFINKEIFIIEIIKLLIFNDIFIKIKIKTIENRKLTDAILWIKKYFIALSEENNLTQFNGIIWGIKERRLISNPIQHPIHELAEIANIVLIIKVVKNNILVEFIPIKILKKKD